VVVGKEAVSMSKRPAGIICLGPILLSVLTFIDGAEFKAISSDLAIVQLGDPSKSRWDVMGGIVVRLKHDTTPDGMTLDTSPPKRPAGPLERLTSNPNAPPQWVR